MQSEHEHAARVQAQSHAELARRVNVRVLVKDDKRVYDPLDLPRPLFNGVPSVPVPGV